MLICAIIDDVNIYHMINGVLSSFLTRKFINKFVIFIN